ncbi:MAG TPA: winged helix-turn-helix domain-containing protein [Vicinamibacterales bacterium]|nr:winged helix-turn-helix domain-containing protein [Vicinamibacterales bacterium]
MRLSFGDFVIDFGERRLVSGQREVHLTPKAFDLLRLLIESRPKALSKQEIFERLWPGTFVTENNLAALVADLRSLLGDNAGEPRFIRTVYAYGYAFAGDVRSAAAVSEPRRNARWLLIFNGREIPLLDGENILGRTGEGIIALEAPSISRQHARLTIAEGRAVIEDLGSKNGTWVGPVEVTGPTPVRNGDEIRLGSAVVTIHASANAMTTETVERPH